MLYMLESRINDDFVSSNKNNSANAFVKEQVMLENDNGNWPSAAGYTDEQRLIMTRTIGNFAIIREKLKTKFKNAAWPTKRDAMKDYSGELVTGRIFCQGQPVWDETVIDRRNSFLADKILEAWPL